MPSALVIDDNFHNRHIFALRWNMPGMASPSRMTVSRG